LFQSTRPARDATPVSRRVMLPSEFQSTRPARDATFDQRGRVNRVASFNPRAPRGTRRSIGMRTRVGHEFQSTRPARDATEAGNGSIRNGKSFNPRAPRGTRLIRRNERRRVNSFNPRAPRGTRLSTKPLVSPGSLFQSTRPARDATRATRAPFWPPRSFNPRAPRGTRRKNLDTIGRS